MHTVERTPYNPNEPYCGVAALFNGDLYTVNPTWAPREDWEVVSTNEICHLAPEGTLDDAEKEQ